MVLSEHEGEDASLFCVSAANISRNGTRLCIYHSDTRRIMLRLKLTKRAICPSYDILEIIA